MMNPIHFLKFLKRQMCSSSHRVFVCFTVLALTMLVCRADVVPGELVAVASLKASVTSSASMSVVEDLAALSGTIVASADDDLEVLENGQPLVDVAGHSAARHFVVRDEGNFMRYIASSTINTAWKRVTAAPQDAVTISANCSTQFAFEITDAPMRVELDFARFGSFTVSVVLQKEDEPAPVYEYLPGSGSSGFSSILEPGIYGLSAQLLPGSSSAPTLNQFLTLQLLLSNSLTLQADPKPVLPPEGDFTHPDIVTSRDGDSLLAIANPQVISETDLGNGTTEFRVTSSVENLGNTPWPEVRVELAEVVSGEPDIEIVNSLPPFAVTGQATAGPPPGSEAVVRVATADATALRAAILDASRFRLRGLEQPVFRYPVRPLDESDLEEIPATSLNAEDDLFKLSQAPLIGSGTILLEWEPQYRLPLLTIIEPANFDEDLITWKQGFDAFLPGIVADVVHSGGKFEIIFFENEPPLFQTISLAEMMKDGRMDMELEPEAHPEDLGVTDVPEIRQTGSGLGVTGFFPSSIPFAFNQVEVSPGIKVSGSFGFRPKAINVTFEMRDSTLDRLDVRAQYTADCNLMLETEEGADNSAQSIAGQEATLLDFQFMSIHLPAGFSFTPRLVLTVGADLSASTALSVPLTAGLDIDITAGVRDGLPYYDSDFTPIPLQVADPGLHEALAVNASAWFDCEIKALFGVSEGLFNTGPTLGIRAAAEFTVAPLADPWWSADATLKTFAGVEFDLAGIVTIFDAEQTLKTWPLTPACPIGAAGPLIPPFAARSFDPQPGFPALGEPRTRWARTLLPDTDGLDLGSAFAIKLDGSDDLLAGCGSASDGIIARFSPEGRLRWSLDPTVQITPGHAVAEPDGGFTILSAKRNSIRLARFDGAGGVIWHKEISGTSGDIWSRNTDLLRRDAPGGGSEYFVLGQGLGNALGDFQSTLAKLDDNGDVIWANFYPISPLASEGTTATPGALGMTAAGDLLICGQTAADLPATSSNLTNISANSYVMKVDGDEGSLVWSTLVGLINSTSFTAISEGPGGEIYAGGNSQSGTLSDLPSMIVSKFDTNGQIIDSVLIGSSSASDAAPHGGQTPFDTIKDMAWVDGQLWVCGQIGLFNAGTLGGVGNGASAFTAMLSEKLDVSRFVIHAGPATDSFNAMVPTPHGLFVAGQSGSFNPWPLGASGEGGNSPRSLLAVMLPWEGRARFHLASAGAQPADPGPDPVRGSYFVLPKVQAASQFTLNTNQSLFAGLGQINLTDDAAGAGAVIPEPFITTANTFPLTPVFIQPKAYHAFEFMSRSLITDLDSYLQWHQIDDTFDGDADGLPADAEFFLGTDSLKADFGVIHFDHLLDDRTGDPFVRFTMPRSKLAAPRVPAVLANTELNGFIERGDFTSSTDPLDADREWLYLEGPALQIREFFRLDFAE